MQPFRVVVVVVTVQIGRYSGVALPDVNKSPFYSGLTTYGGRSAHHQSRYTHPYKVSETVRFVFLGVVFYVVSRCLSHA